MHRLVKVATIMLAAVLVLASTAGGKANAQSDQKNYIIDATFGKGPDTFNSIFCVEASCATASANIFPGLIGRNPKNLVFEPNIPGGLAKSWKISDDRLTWTITLKNTYKWSDGVPVTSKDILGTWNLIINAATESPNATITEDVESVTAPDDYTVVVKLKRPQCDSAPQSIDGIYGTGGIQPAHILEKIDPAKLKDAEFNLKPDVTSGQYKLNEFRVGELVRYDSDQSYPDKQGAKIEHDGLVVKIVESQAVLIEQFLAGQINVVEEPRVADRDRIKAAAAKDPSIKIFTTTGSLWDHIVLNLGDPKDPQPAFELDKDGKPQLDKPIKQKPHPVFGDVRVRRAFQLGINVQDLIKGAVFGYGKQMTSLLNPSNRYTDPALKPIGYDKAAAEKLLDAAGWVKGADGFRVAKGSQTAPDGTRLSFKLMTIAGNARRGAVAQIIKDELKDIGFDVDVQSIDFNAMIDQQNAQTFDAAIAARGSVTDNSIDWSFLFDPNRDIPGQDGNAGSYINPQLTKDMQEVSAVKGCDEKRTTELWKSIQKTLQDDQPYIFLYTQDYMYAYRGLEGVNPTEYTIGYTDTWKLATAK